MVVAKPGFVRFRGRRQHELSVLEDRIRLSYVPATVTETSGLVKGILYSETRSSAVLADKREIVHEKDTIQGITIVKIHKDKVEFAKDDQRWTQKVGETPDAHWK
jgi:hypothetical protein